MSLNSASFFDVHEHNSQFPSDLPDIDLLDENLFTKSLTSREL